MTCSNLNDNHLCNIRSSFSTSTINNDSDHVTRSFFFLFILTFINPFEKFVYFLRDKHSPADRCLIRILYWL